MKNCSLTGGKTNGSNMQNKKTETKQNRLGRFIPWLKHLGFLSPYTLHHKDDNPCE